MSQADFLCAKQVAQLFGTSVKWVYAHQREIPGRIKIAGLIRWDKTVLLDSVREQATQPAKRQAKRHHHALRLHRRHGRTPLPPGQNRIADGRVRVERKIVEIRTCGRPERRAPGTVGAGP